MLIGLLSLPRMTKEKIGKEICSLLYVKQFSFLTKSLIVMKYENDP